MPVDPLAAFSPLRPGELARDLALGTSADGRPAWAGLARVIRVAAGRWGACRRLELKRHALDLCGAAGFAQDAAEERAEEALDLLVELRELEEASVAAASPEEREKELGGLEEETPQAPRERPAAAGRYLIPALPRLVDCGSMGFLLGPTDELLPRVGRAGAAEGPASVVRWVGSAELPADLRAEHGIGHWTLSDWVGAPEHNRWQRRWATRLDPAQEAPVIGELPELWRLIDQALDELGMPVSDDAGFRVLAGRPGDLFGRPDAPGRWVSAGQAPDGRWCAARRGYSDHHWQSGVVELQGGKLRRWLDLYDSDELWWAHLSRAARLGAPERFRVEGDEIRLATALPRQLRRLGALGRRERWRWSSPAQTAIVEVLEGAGLRAR